MLRVWLPLLLLSTLVAANSVELTFELPDNAKQCFHEDIREGTESFLEFQVVSGGKYDVDVKLTGPRGETLYEGVKKQFDNYKFKTAQTGTYTFCFSNEFSTFSHKLIYFEFQAGEEAPLPGIHEHITAMTQMEQSSVNIHESLNTIMDAQTHYRLNEAKGRKRAEELNSHVMSWSLFETCVVLVIGFGQVMVLKNFFTDKRTAVSAT